MTKRKPKQKGRLTTKVLLLLILSSILIGFSCGTVGYIIFTRVMQRMYYNDTNQLGDMVVNYLNVNNLEAAITELRTASDENKYEKIVQLINENQDYKNLQRFLIDLKESTNISQIYIADFRNQDGSVGDSYFLFAGIRGSQQDPELIPIGERGQFEDQEGIFSMVYETKRPSDRYIIVEYEDGIKEMVSLLPVLSEQGEVIGIVSVEEPMTLLTSSLKEFLISVILYSTLITAIIMGIFIVINRRFLIRPIEKITHAATDFISDHTSAKEELSTVKTNDEIQTLAESILTMEMDITNYIKDIQRITSEKERVDTELKVATTIQEGMLPSSFPEENEFEIFATMKPAKEVGGDFYDLFMIDEDHLAFNIGDVSGKGIPAALFMAITKTLIEDQVLEGKSPADVFTTVNEKLIANNSSDMFVTAWLGVLELSTGKLTFVNAGHNPPIIKESGKDYETIKVKPGLVLGGLSGIKYKEQTLKLEPGSKVFIYTDGVTEAQDIDEILYGEKRLINILNKSIDLNVKELLPKVKEDIDRFVKEAEQFDDITMLALELKQYKEVDDD